MKHMLVCCVLCVPDVCACVCVRTHTHVSHGDCAAAAFFKCDTVAKVCQFGAWGTFVNILDWQGLECSADVDCRSPLILDTMECQGHFAYRPPPQVRSMFLSVWLQSQWAPSISTFGDQHVLDTGQP